MSKRQRLGLTLGLIPYSKTGVAMMEVHPALGLVYEDNDPD